MGVNVRISTSSDASNAMPTVPFCLFGYGVFQAWETMLHKTSVISPIAGADDVSMLLRILGMLAQVLSLFFILLNLKKVPFKKVFHAAVLPIGAMGVVSTLVIWLGGYSSSAFGFTMSLFGWLIWGCSSSILFFAWISVYSLSTLRQLCLCLAGSLLVYSGIVFVLCYIPSNVSALVAALMPAYSVFSCKKSFDALDPASKDAEMKSLSLSDPIMKMLVRVFLAVFVYSLIDCALIDPLTTRRGAGLNANGGYMLLAPAVAGLLLLVTASFSRKRLSAAAIYRALLPTVALAFFLLPFVQGFSLVSAGVIGSFGFKLFSIFGWLIVFDITTRERAATVGALLLMNIFSMIGSVAGSVVGVYLAMFELFKDKDLLTMLCLGSTLVLLVFAMLLFSDEILFASSKEGSRVGSDASETKSSHMLPTAEEIFKIKTDRICTRYKLTPREAEVFVLLAKGRSNRLIQERLVISASTVDSHITHIYRKCGVHSRQEIMDFIEQEHIDPQQIVQKGDDA